MGKNLGNPPRLADLLVSGHRLEIWCRRCPHQRLIPPAEAVALFGSEATFSAVARRAVCGGCGAKGRDGHIGCRPSVNDLYRARGMTATAAQGAGYGFADIAKRT